MSKHRPLKPSNKYFLPKETFLTVVHYCKQYPLWVDELRKTADTGRAIRYDQDRVQTSGDYDPTSEIAIRRVELTKKKEMVDTAALLVAGKSMASWLINGVCHDRTYTALRAEGIPCGKNYYYALRRRFYYEMAKRI